MRALPLLMMAAISFSLPSHIRGAVDISSEGNLTILASALANSLLPHSLVLSDLPDDSRNLQLEERLLRGLGYIPLKFQPLHSDYWKEGFPTLMDMITAPEMRDGGGTSYPALPSIELRSGARSSIIVVALDISAASSVATWLKEFNKLCEIQLIVPSRCSIDLTRTQKLFLCHLNDSQVSPTSLLDMLGFLALQFSGKSKDIYMEIQGSFPYTPVRPFTDFNVTYDCEKSHPRCLWPGWVNLYMHLRSSYSTCVEFASCRGSSKEDCANLFSKINQVSLTYVYFVCRLHSGEAGDALCPSLCQTDPCSKIRHAISGSCMTIGFKIHRFDYLCLCEHGYLWESKEENDIEGNRKSDRCVLAARPAAGMLVEECTRLEMETFCSASGTESCKIDRLSDNRRPTCNCWQGFGGVNCGYKLRNVCEMNNFKGHVLCRAHEGLGTCARDNIDPTAYTCNCTEDSHLRWRSSSGGEECLPWIPSKWDERSLTCGYRKELRNRLPSHCRNFGPCDTVSLMRFVVEQEKQFACNTSGTCEPAVAQTDGKTPAQCKCSHGHSGQFCHAVNHTFSDWTPWTICYAKGIVRANERARLRFQRCTLLERFSNGSAPKCIGGQAQSETCPAVSDDLPDSLTPSDYGVASQAVISMWRIVELMILADALLLIILAAVLVFQWTVLKGRQEAADDE